MHRYQPLAHPPKQFWKRFCGLAFRAAVVLFLMSMSSKWLPFNISFIFNNRTKSLGARSGEYGGCSYTVICLLAKNSLTDSALIQAPTFSRRHTKTHSDNNRRHSERDCHRSTTTQLWKADMPASSNHAEVSVHCCHGKQTLASSRTLLWDLVCFSPAGCRLSGAQVRVGFSIT
jgi:hypothetical protein